MVALDRVLVVVTFLWFYRSLIMFVDSEDLKSIFGLEIS